MELRLPLEMSPGCPQPCGPHLAVGELDMARKTGVEGLHLLAL